MPAMITSTIAAAMTAICHTESKSVFEDDPVFVDVPFPGVVVMFVSGGTSSIETV
jgi:hypothetical protein